MLLLSRREGEWFLLRSPDGSEIWVGLHEVKGNHAARIAVEAPVSVKVVREELLDTRDRRQAR